MDLTLRYQLCFTSQTVRENKKWVLLLDFAGTKHYRWDVKYCVLCVEGLGSKPGHLAALLWGLEQQKTAKKPVV